jgi:hypothetical protein
VLSAKRLREHAALFAALLGVVALVSGLSVGVVGYLAQSANEGVRSGLASRAGAELALRASLALDADAARQDTEVRDAIAHSFAGIPIAVDRTVGSRVDVARAKEDGSAASAVRAQVLSIPDLPDRATIVDGVWPASPAEVTMQAAGAERLSVAVGDTLFLSNVPVTLVGTWTVDDTLDPRWLGDPLVTSGQDDIDFGPVVIDESLWPQLDTDPRARWTLVPDGSMLTAGDLVTIVAEWNRINTAWHDQVSSQLITLEKQGRFKRTALELLTRVDGLQAIQPVVLLLLAAIALVTLAELGRLLTTTRDDEIALLWSRGASALDVGLTTAAEVALAAAAGAAVGTGVAVGALALLLTPEAVASAGPALWIVPLTVVLGAVLVVAGSAFRSARRQTVRDPSDAAGRARRLAGPGLVILATAAAALSVWQLSLYGSPLTPTADGGTDVDPVGVVAPALTLVAVVLLALVLFPRVATLAERATRRSGISGTLAARTVARRLQLVAAPIVVVAVATSTVVVASAYAATWSDSFQRTSELRAGGPLHLSVGFPGLVTSGVDIIARTPGVDAVAPLDFQPLQIGGDTGSVVAATPATIAHVATAASGSFDREAAAAAMTVDLPGPTIPEGAAQLTLTTVQAGFAVPPEVSAQLTDAYGVLRDVPFTDPQDLGVAPEFSTEQLEFHRVEYTLDVPDAPGPHELLTFDVHVGRDAVPEGGSAQFALDDLAADSAPLELAEFWLPETPITSFEAPLSNFSGQGFTIGGDADIVRMTPSFDDNVTDRSSPPVVISQQLADLYELEVGDLLSFSLQNSYDRSNCQVAMIVPAIPGADIESAVLIDLGYVLHQRLRVKYEPDLPREFWVDTTDPDAVAAALRPQLPPNTRMQSGDDPAGRTVLGSAAVALWLGALGCLVLAIITVVAVVRAQLRSRRLDVVVLRAIGFGSRDQAGVRRRELALVLGFGALTGIVAGAAVALLTVPQLARAAVVEPYTTVPTPLLFELTGLGAGVAALVAALVVIVSVYTSRVANQARTAIGAEEVT